MSALLILLALLQAEVPDAAATEQPAEASATLKVKGADLELLESVRAIADRVATLRGQSFERRPVAVRTPDHMRVVAAEIRALNVLRRERLEARGRAWADLGLGRPSSPETLYFALAADLAGIGFDPQGNRLLVAPDRLSWQDFAATEPDDARSTVLMMTGVRVDEPLTSHLLMHVRQRERTGGDSLEQTTDALLAHSAWAEGEANLLAIRYLFAGMGLADDVLEQQIDPADVLDGALFPTNLDRLGGAEGALVRFVYQEGFSSAVQAYHRGGWEALDEAMLRRLTTRDLLHPDREPARPETIAVPRLPQTESLRLMDEDVLGEQAMFVLVSTVTGKDNLALQAGDGWAGDRLFRWEAGDADGQSGITLWISRWVDETAAKDFDYAMDRVLASRFPERPAVTLEGGQRAIQTSTRIFRIDRAGREVRVRVSDKRLDPLPPQIGP